MNRVGTAKQRLRGAVGGVGGTLHRANQFLCIPVGYAATER